ncbi:MAG: NUDIX domain-containing protein [Thermomicrobiales bacterium]
MIAKSSVQTELDVFLSTHTAVASESALWRGGQIKFTVSLFLTTDMPPDELVTSARCMIVAFDQVLVLTNPDGEHILPGGRRERRESIEDALVREVYEETGITVQSSEHIAISHYHHESP